MWNEGEYIMKQNSYSLPWWARFKKHRKASLHFSEHYNQSLVSCIVAWFTFSACTLISETRLSSRLRFCLLFSWLLVQQDLPLSAVAQQSWMIISTLIPESIKTTFLTKLMSRKAKRTSLHWFFLFGSRIYIYIYIYIWLPW